ncbi:class I SAM-dependent methyltransferase [candidate division KSB1 bacterium]|nr:class I SAM-dependent methyltransferase [candidate division KSB1 bacterium]
MEKLNGNEWPRGVPGNGDWLIAASHPNARLWQNYHHFAAARGELARVVLQSITTISNRCLLDLGCGFGGVAEVLARAGGTVLAVDADWTRLEYFNAVRAEFSRPRLQMSATALGFKNAVFDGVVMIDVLEHIATPEQVFAEIARILKPAGWIYLVTPNRWSVLNWVCDPHWNLPFVAGGSRQWVAFWVQHVFRREKLTRTDLPVLLSWFKIQRLATTHGLQLKLCTRRVLQFMWQTPEAVVCHPWHLKIVNWLRQSRRLRRGLSHISEQAGLVNWFITPTWYFIGQKK